MLYHTVTTNISDPNRIPINMESFSFSPLGDDFLPFSPSLGFSGLWPAGDSDANLDLSLFDGALESSDMLELPPASVQLSRAGLAAASTSLLSQLPSSLAFSPPSAPSHDSFHSEPREFELVGEFGFEVRSAQLALRP